MVESWQSSIHDRLTGLLSSWPEADSLRKAWARKLLAGNWNDARHVELAAGFVKDNLAPSTTTHFDNQHALRKDAKNDAQASGNDEIAKVFAPEIAGVHNDPSGRMVPGTL